MSPTDVHDLADDAAERALRADAEQWQASHPAPSLDDAVRRLVAEERALGRRRAGWWRPAGVAAAVLVLIGGVVGVAVHHRAADTVARPSPAATSTGVDGAPTPTLTALPPGFVEVSGHVASPVDAARGPGARSVLPVVLRSWVGGRTLSPSAALPMSESFILSSLGREMPVHGTHTVQGSPAEVDEETWPAGSADGATVVSIVWDAGGRALRLVYSGPGPHAGPARGLSAAEVLAVADSLRADPPPATAPVSLVPTTMGAGSSTLTLAHFSSLSARRGADGRLEVSLAGGPSALPGTTNRCHPFEQAVLTGATATSVTVTVADYLPISGRDLPCTAEAYLGRWVPVALDGPLGARTVVDGSTGKPVTLSSSG